MYEQAEYRFDWSSVKKKFLVILIIGILIFCIATLLIKPKNKTSYFDDNLTTMTSVAKKYYSQNNTAEKLTLEEMVNKKMVASFIDEDGNTCNLKKSYAQIDNNKVIVNLICNHNQKTTETSL